MKYIKLFAPRMIAGVNRHPAEGPLAFDDDTVDGIVKAGAGVEIDEDSHEVDAEDDGTDVDGLDELKVPDLTILATKEGTPLNGATKKDDLIAAIRAHRNPVVDA